MFSDETLSGWYITFLKYFPGCYVFCDVFGLLRTGTEQGTVCEGNSSVTKKKSPDITTHNGCEYAHSKKKEKEKQKQKAQGEQTV